MLKVPHTICGQPCEWAQEQAAKSAPAKGFHGVPKDWAAGLIPNRKHGLNAGYRISAWR